MGLLELFLMAVGLSMDAFAVSVCKGLATKQVRLKHMLCAGLWFGGFQALMPTIGYLLGSGFADYVTAFDHWIAFVLLTIIGGNMIKEALEKDSCEENNHKNAAFDWKTMFVLAVATSIDALAVGVTFAFLKVNLLFAVLFIGAVTFTFSMAGIKVGSIFGDKYKSKSELAGGIILIAIGVKILLEHLGILG